MPTTYSRRALYPFISLTQVAEAPRGRALSPDGRNWEIQVRVKNRAARDHAPDDDQSNYQYARVAALTEAGLVRRPMHPFIDSLAVNTAIETFMPLITEPRLPFAAIDTWEYWLLDSARQEPLALLSTCISAAEVRQHPAQTEWMAMPAAQLPIEDPDATGEEYLAPVNHRLQKRVAERAGRYPRAVWVERKPGDEADFPPCLLRESWEDPGDSDLCRRYLDRLAPRLLMMQGLARDERARLEQAARNQAIEVAHFFPLYPEIVDEKLINSLRVEAQLRRAARPNRV